MTLDGKAIVACPLRLLAAPLGTCLAGIDSVLKNVELHGSSLLWANLLQPYLALGKSALAKPRESSLICRMLPYYSTEGWAACSDDDDDEAENLSDWSDEFLPVY
ncbi:hypothetical protein BY996DRAFT_6422674 [Phakopsora pachyrhizi]|nr:hypothetical protein BY996DRAFT_6422674 [Phakopsora pachyrhizi]